MLVANTSDGKRLSLGEKWGKSDLIGIRSKEKFHCPECSQEVVMKLGSKKIWHFAHLAGAAANMSMIVNLNIIFLESFNSSIG